MVAITLQQRGVAASMASPNLDTVFNAHQREPSWEILAHQWESLGALIMMKASAARSPAENFVVKYAIMQDSRPWGCALTQGLLCNVSELTSLEGRHPAHITAIRVGRCSKSPCQL